MHDLWVLTDYGNSAVTLPLALLTAIVLFAKHERRLAFAWVLTVGGCGAVMIALKLAFTACGYPLTPLEIVSPSGHTAMSAAVYLSLALLLGTRLRPMARRIVVGGAVLVVAGIAVSRVLLNRHNAAEVAIGFAVGLAATGWFYAMLRRQPNPAVPVTWLTLGGIAVVVAMHGTRLMIEPAVHSIAWTFRFALPWCR